MSSILIVEDVAPLRDQYAYDLKRLGGHDAATAGSVKEALEVLEREALDCVILDLEMPGADGFELLKELNTREISVPVIVYTGTGDYDRCVRAVKLGAYGFVDKAEPMERVLREVENAIERSRLGREVKDLRRRLDEESSMVGESGCLAALRDSIHRLAPIPSPVLILGESGTGKELVARDLHRLSPRASGPFIPVNCAALPENLVESELFGHERGAFTGADRVRRGAFELASGGTLFLDEIGELPAAVQAKLLRVLEEETVARVGGTRAVSIDSRVVAATNRDLDAEAVSGSFRQDLLYRLNVHTIEVPPLRERLDDIPLLVAHFLEVTAKRFGQRPLGIHPDAVRVLQDHDWRRNNVRELRNAVERMVIAAAGDEIAASDVPREFRGASSDNSAASPAGTLKERKAEAERRIILAALERNGWHITKTASELGLADHASLSKIMRRHGLRKK
jgi:two-component system nitrogen regulation response regulator NtrX